jgi:aryl-alcohol dehydrogenase-like predicted oxidoreductase
MGMKKRTLGANGVEVGEIGLGCMGMSWAYDSTGRDDKESIRVIRRALELGANLIDTADVYGPYTNEELVGRALERRRDEGVLATKVGLVVHDQASWDVRPCATPDHIRKSCEGSLRRLGVEAIDLYYLHRPDPEVPIEESIGAMAELVHQGKVRQIGISEVWMDQLDKALSVHPIAAVQTELSLWSREALDEVVPWCAEHGVAFVAYSPLGRGFLGGRLSAEDIEEGDFRASNPRFQPEAMIQNARIADGVRAVAERLGATPAQVAIAWVLAQGEHVIAIPGTKRVAYLEENVAASDLELSASDLAELDALPPAVGDRY